MNTLIPKTLFKKFFRPPAALKTRLIFRLPFMRKAKI